MSTSNLQRQQLTAFAIMSRVDNFFFICFSFFLVVIIICNIVPHSDTSGKNLYSGHEGGNRSNVMQPERAYLNNRKLLLYGICTNRDISISQSRYSTTGIPGYIVQIVNTCVSGCVPSSIHLHCGWFASARIVNPRIFKRLSYDDCLVNGGNPLRTGQVLRFTYANSFMYPLSFKSAAFC